MGHRFLDRFDKMKNCKKNDPAARHREASLLLCMLKDTLKDMKFDSCLELQFCMFITGTSPDIEKWLYLLDDNHKMNLFNNWFEPWPRLTSILPWFDVHQNWSKMTCESYLVGARILVNCSPLTEQIIDKHARLIIDDWATWKTAVLGEDEESFVEQLHLEVAVAKLSLQCSNADCGTPVSCPFSADAARKLLKLVGHHGRNKSGSGSFAALCATGRTASDTVRQKPLTNSKVAGIAERSAGDCDSSAANPVSSTFKVGDQVITRTTKEKESFDSKRARVLKVLSKTVRVLLLSGPCQGQEQMFATNMLTLLQTDSADLQEGAATGARLSWN
jgi:hypothetical protein